MNRKGLTAMKACDSTSLCILTSNAVRIDKGIYENG